MIKPLGLFIGLLGVLFLTTPAFTENAFLYSSPEQSAAVVCVARAARNRETGIANAITTYTRAINEAYGKRQMDLVSTYESTEYTDPKVLKKNIKNIWSTFRGSTKSASGVWKKSKNEIWKTFKAEARACKDTSNTSDASNSASEI